MQARLPDVALCHGLSAIAAQIGRNPNQRRAHSPEQEHCQLPSAICTGQHKQVQSHPTS